MSYVAILRTPAVAPVVLATALSRLPVGLNPLAALLFVHDRTGSYAAAGVVTGALMLGTAVGQPVVSRLVDARGMRTLIPAGGLHAAGLGGVLAFGHAAASTGVLAASALVAGFALPPTSSVLRASWPRLLGDRPALLPSAFALDAVLVQLAFMTGPLIVGGLAATVTVDAALVLSAIAGFAATAAFVALAPSVPRRRRSSGLLGPLSAPAIQTLVLSQIPLGVAFGAIQVAVPAFADAERQRELAGVLLALLSLASIAGALIYGARPRRRPLHEVHVRFAVFVPLGLAPVAVAWSVPAMCFLLLPGGALLSAFFATRNELAGAVAPPGTRTEAVTWPLTALIAGTAGGAVIAGAIAEGAGWRIAVLVAASSAALSAMLVCLRRGTLVSAPASE